MTNNSQAEYTRLETADGSPTLRLSPTGEAMHAMDGAFTETQYIYQPTVEKAFGSVANPAILSVGLGLGYNEILTVCEGLKVGRAPALIQSYESVDGLRQCFSQWLQAKPSALNFVYDEILGLYASRYGLEPQAVHGELMNLFSTGRLRLDGAIEALTTPPPCHGILFDAFSSKTSPELWNAEFLNRFFKEAAAEICHVSTYACTGDLKRALKLNGFALEIRKGFGAKRESTSATKAATPHQ